MYWGQGADEHWGYAYKVNVSLGAGTDTRAGHTKLIDLGLGVQWSRKEPKTNARAPGGCNTPLLKCKKRAN